MGVNHPTPSAMPGDLAARLLVCPRSHAAVSVCGDELICATSGFTGRVLDGVAVMMDAGGGSFFDDKFQVMTRGHQCAAEWNLCYAQQIGLLDALLQPGQVVLDVGCGPALPYRPPAGVTVVGLEPSFDSIRANGDVALRVNGSATEIPLRTASVDVVVCFYSVHHMVGANRAETRGLVSRAFREFGRVLKPGGVLLVFEMAPNPAFALLQRWLWNPARRILRGALDMHFWPAAELTEVAASQLPRGAAPTRRPIRSSPWALIRPVFSWPWLKLPIFCHPLRPCLYQWRLPAEGETTPPSP